MTTVEVLNIQETGSDYLVLRNAGRGVRVNFGDDKEYTKEESAAFFRGLEGKPAAIPADSDEPFFISVDFWPLTGNDVRVVPFRFAVSSIELMAGATSRTIVLCPVHRIQMRETDVSGALFFYCPYDAGCNRRYSKEHGHITTGDLPSRPE
jgi:hypothetical protein